MNTTVVTISLLVIIICFLAIARSRRIARERAREQAEAAAVRAAERAARREAREYENGRVARLRAQNLAIRPVDTPVTVRHRRHASGGVGPVAGTTPLIPGSTTSSYTEAPSTTHDGGAGGGDGGGGGGCD